MGYLDKFDDLLDHLVISDGDGPNGSSGVVRYWKGGVDIEAKQAILQLYREWAMELIGENEVFEHTNSCVLDAAFCETPMPCTCDTNLRNSLRAELRHKLQENE